MSGIERICDVLKPVKDATIMICSEKDATISLVVPTLYKLKNITMKDSDDDSNLVLAARTNLEGRYIKDDVIQCIHVSTPRSKSEKPCLPGL